MGEASKLYSTVVVCASVVVQCLAGCIVIMEVLIPFTHAGLLFYWPVSGMDGLKYHSSVQKTGRRMRRSRGACMCVC